MAIRIPPQHPVDGKPVWVSPKDDAWKPEIREMFDSGKALPPTHPVQLYLSGTTRYHYGGIAEYIDESKRPTKWALRKLKHADRDEIHDMLRADRFTAAMTQAAMRGVVGVENGPELDLGAKERLTFDDLERLDAIDPTLVEGLGIAVWLASRPLDEDGAEGKH